MYSPDELQSFEEVVGSSIIREKLFIENKMKNIDYAFYLLMAGSVVKEVSEAYTKMKSGEPVDWILIGFVVVGSLIYGFYNHITGTKPVPVV